MRVLWQRSHRWIDEDHHGQPNMLSVVGSVIGADASRVAQIAFAKISLVFGYLTDLIRQVFGIFETKGFHAGDPPFLSYHIIGFQIQQL